MKKILAVVAHPDDEIIGLGGTLIKHQKNGDQVYVVIMGDGKSSRSKNYKIDKKIYSASIKETQSSLKTIGVHKYWRLKLPDNRFDSVDLIEIVREISRIAREIRPDIIYTHHFGDLNIDHQKTSEATITTFRPIENKVEAIYMFETLSSTEMAGHKHNTAFLPNMFVDITDEISKKILAMSKYKSELHDFPHPRSLETIKYNAKVWGSKINIEAAEAFYVFRQIQ